MAKPEAAAKGEFGIIEANGARQWTVNGKPLYYFAGDAKPGDRNGDGKGGVWHVVAAKPEVKAAVTAAPASSPLMEKQSGSCASHFANLPRTYLRQEPYAVILHVRICAGGRG